MGHIGQDPKIQDDLKIVMYVMEQEKLQDYKQQRRNCRMKCNIECPFLMPSTVESFLLCKLNKKLRDRCNVYDGYSECDVKDKRIAKMKELLEA